MMNSINNTLSWINNNWSAIVVACGLLLLLFQKAKSYMKLSDQEKIDVALSTLKTTMLKYVTEAELDWKDYKASGSIKRSEVVDKIFKEYPILSKVTDQKSLLDNIDMIIDESLEALDKVLEKQETVITEKSE